LLNQKERKEGKKARGEWKLREETCSRTSGNDYKGLRFGRERASSWRTCGRGTGPSTPTCDRGQKDLLLRGAEKRKKKDGESVLAKQMPATVQNLRKDSYIAGLRSLDKKKRIKR